mmetsp:Transcript_67290/g.145201  ORF Transcript_67290/g.145201 Transcript_67290/m.145201 type:complete len:233 (+) Transcript_67290:59-757(+)
MARCSDADGGAAPEGGRAREEEAKKAPVAVALGYLMLAGAMLYKFPQIWRIRQAKSARGISLATTCLGMAIQVTSLGYAIGEGHPFSAYGEGVPAFVGSLAVALQTLHYDRGARAPQLLAAAAAALASALAACRARWLFGERAGRRWMHSLQASVPALLVVEKMPQILQAWRAGSAGEQSLATSVAAWAGNWVRLYTSLTQLRHDPKACAPHLVSWAANGVVTAQIVLYRGR